MVKEGSTSPLNHGPGTTAGSVATNGKTSAFSDEMGSKLALALLLVICSFLGDIHAIPVDSELSVSINETSSKANSSSETLMKNETSTLDLSNDTIAIETDSGSDNSTAPKSIRRGRLMSFDFPSTSNVDVVSKSSKFKPIQSRILTGSQTSLMDISSNTFQDSKYSMYGGSNNREMAAQAVSHHQLPFYGSGNPVINKYDAMLIAQPPPAPVPVKTLPPADRFSTVSYSNPASYGGQGGVEPSDLIPYYHDRYAKPVRHPHGTPVMYQLVPVKPPVPQPYEPTLSEHVKDTLFKVKDHVSGTMQKVKNVLGFHGFSEKVASPDILAVAPVAAGLLAGGLAVAYFASRQGASRNATAPFSIFGKRSVRDIISEEDLNHIVARLDPVQREYLQKLQFYGPQRWKDVTCAKYIFCDVMSKATPIHVLDMQRKIGIFLSRMDESTARYVEVILKDVMLAIQARDCSRFSCGQASWGYLPPRPPAPPPLPPQFIGHHPLFPGHNFLRRQ